MNSMCLLIFIKLALISSIMVWSLASVELFLASERNNTLTLSGSLLTPSTAENICITNVFQIIICNEKFALSGFLIQ